MKWERRFNCLFQKLESPSFPRIEKKELVDLYISTSDGQNWMLLLKK